MDNIYIYSYNNITFTFLGDQHFNNNQDCQDLNIRHFINVDEYIKYKFKHNNKNHIKTDFFIEFDYIISDHEIKDNTDNNSWLSTLSTFDVSLFSKKIQMSLLSIY
jgi:hypothetical protein